MTTPTDTQSPARSMRVLCVGDVVGEEAAGWLASRIGQLRDEHELDWIVVNAENGAVTGPNPMDGFGMTVEIVDTLLEAGVDAITGGNHSWDGPDVDKILSYPSQPRRGTRPGPTHPPRRHHADRDQPALAHSRAARDGGTEAAPAVALLAGNHRRARPDRTDGHRPAWRVPVGESVLRRRTRRPVPRGFRELVIRDPMGLAGVVCNCLFRGLR